MICFKMLHFVQHDNFGLFRQPLAHHKFEKEVYFVYLESSIIMINENNIQKLIEFASGDSDVVSVILFGSAARSEDNTQSDVDICIILKRYNYSKIFLSKKKLKFIAEFGNLDIQIYQQLPVYIRQRILKEGKILFCKDEDELYNVAFETIQQYEDFKPIYEYYLQEVQYDR